VLDGDVISSIKHPAVAAARRAATGGAFLVEGLNLVSQALGAGAPVQSVFVRDPVEDDAAALLGAARKAGVGCHVVTKGVFFRILDLGYETSACILAAVRVEPVAPARALSLVDAGSCLLVGESIQDPRNVGVLVRNADAFGAAGAVFTSDSANPYSRESVRSSTGSVFRVPLTLTSALPAFLEELKAKSVTIVGTSAQAEMPCWDVEIARPCAVAVGNETEGLSPQAKDLCDVLVAIPMGGGAHSFNVTVAAGIVLYEMARQAAIQRAR
jgi:TrmH family RNA methyltransferase